jgi:hypothetical protein
VEAWSRPTWHISRGTSYWPVLTGGDPCQTTHRADHPAEAPFGAVLKEQAPMVRVRQGPGVYPALRAAAVVQPLYNSTWSFLQYFTVEAIPDKPLRSWRELHSQTWHAPPVRANDLGCSFGGAGRRAIRVADDEAVGAVERPVSI